MSNTLINEAIFDSVFPGGDDNDLAMATQDGIRDSAFITYSGDDKIVGINSNENGVGILDSVIISGDDNDNVIGTALAEGGIGIVGGAIDLGFGDDELVTRGGAFGIEDVLIDAGPGNDTIDVGSGIGLISGGQDTDTIILEENFDQYDLLPLDELNRTFRIEGKTELTLGTNIIADQFEVFQFADLSIEAALQGGG